MTEAQFALLVLGVCLIASNAFWAWNTQKLINKLMSRNYQEFKIADVTTDKREDKIKPGTEFGAIDDMAGVFN